METAENLFLGFGCWRKRNFAKVSVYQNVGRLKVISDGLLLTLFTFATGRNYCNE